MKQQTKLHLCSDRIWEQVVFAEVLIPEVTNVYGDYWTPEAVRQAAYMYMRKGYIIDVEHDLFDVGNSVYVVESFIAREGDPTFVPGSWVIGVHIDDNNLWQKVLDGDLNGFSFEAVVSSIKAILEYSDDNFRQGVTEPDPFDGHTHTFAVWVDDNNRPIAGGTGEAEGHSHLIKTHTVTESSAGHKHRYIMLSGGNND